MLAITRMTVTPMQRLIVEWDPSDIEPASYTVTVTNADFITTETVSGDVRVARVSEQLPMLRTYTVTVTDGTETDTQYQEVDINPSPSNLLRQAVFDAVYDAGIADLYMVHDGLYQPDDINEGETIDIPLPAFEVKMPLMSGTPEIGSGIRTIETWEVPFNILDEGQENTPESISDTYEFLFAVQRAIEATGDLKLSARGVFWRGWDFTAPSAIEGRDNLSGLSSSIVVPVTRIR